MGRTLHPLNSSLFPIHRRLDYWLALLLLGCATPAAAQPVWTGPPEHASTVSLEWLKPAFDQGDDISFFTSSLVLSGQATLTDRLMIVGEVPASYVRAGDQGASSVGNPFVGIELRGHDPSIFMELGIRLPVADDVDVLPAAIGSLIDLNRFGAYGVNVLPLQLVANYHYAPTASNVSVRVRGGSETFLPVAQDAGGAMILTYGVQGWYRGAQVEGGGGLTGRWAVGQEDGFGESSLHQATITVRGIFGRVRPGVLVRIPVDDPLNDVFTATVGVTVTVALADGAEK